MKLGKLLNISRSRILFPTRRMPTNNDLKLTQKKLFHFVIPA